MASMRPKTWLASLVIIAATAVAGCASPDEARATADPAAGTTAAEQIILTPDAIPWGPGPDSLPPDARLAVLSGDPAAEGPFTMRAEMPADYLIPPHTHPNPERVTILSGTAFLGTGTEVDRASVKELPAASFFELPPGTEHHFFTGSEPAIIQLHGEGPWAIEYVDPADDPRNQQMG